MSKAKAVIMRKIELNEVCHLLEQLTAVYLALGYPEDALSVKQVVRKLRARLEEKSE